MPLLTPESHRIPTPFRWAWYRPHSDDDDTDEDIQMSQRSLQNIFDSIHGEDAFLPISPRRERQGTDAMQGGGKEGFQPTKADVNKLVQKLKCIQHGYQAKQMRMLLVSDSKFMRKIERTTDAKQLQDCVLAAAQRMGLVLPVPTQHDGKSQAQQQSSQTQAQALPINTIPCVQLQDRVREKARMITVHNPKPKAKVRLLIKAKEKVKATLPISRLLLQVIPKVMAKAKGRVSTPLRLEVFNLTLKDGTYSLSLNSLPHREVCICARKLSMQRGLLNLELGNYFLLASSLPSPLTLG